MRPIRITYAPSFDDDGICEAQTGTEDVALVLDGSLVSDGVAVIPETQYIEIFGSGDNSGVVFTIVGEDASGNPLSDSVTGVINDSVMSVVAFKTVTSITPDANTDGDVTVGVDGTGVTRFALLNINGPYGVTTFSVVVDSAAATFAVSLDVTIDDPEAPGAFWVEEAGFVESTLGSFGSVVIAARARFTEIDNFDPGAGDTIRLAFIQAGSGG